MLAIARGLIGEPKLMLLDEPSTGLAPIVVKNIMEIIKQISKIGIIMLLVEQNALRTLFGAEGQKEGRAAFMEKRKPPSKRIIGEIFYGFMGKNWVVGAGMMGARLSTHSSS